MALEYSYFRAEGFSREAIDIAAEARREMQELRRKLCARFGAADFTGGYDAQGAFDITGFMFSNSQKVPDEWEVVEERKFPDGTPRGTVARPPRGSPEHFDIASMCGLMARAARQATLEGVFGCPVTEREHPEGEFETLFVREQMMKGGAGGKIYGEWLMTPKPAGRPGIATDPVAATDLGGKMYIRVPNRPGTEEPVFTPPDAVPVSYRRMLEIDQAELDARVRFAMNNNCFGC
jgi:hypothetical protein